MGSREHTQILRVRIEERFHFDVNHSPLCIRIAAAVMYSLISSGVRRSQILRIDFVAYNIKQCTRRIPHHEQSLPALCIVSPKAQPRSPYTRIRPQEAKSHLSITLLHHHKPSCSAITTRTSSSLSIRSNHYT